MPDLSVIVVSYRTPQLTRRCLASLREASGEAALEVLVVDNASGDGSAEAVAEGFPEFELLPLEENVGFGRACNLGARQAAGRYLLLLNPDAVVRPGSLRRLVGFADDHPDIDIFGGRSFYEDGSFNPTSCSRRPSPWSAVCMGTGLASLFRRSKLFDPESMGSWARDTVRDVDVVTGFFLMIRRSAWDLLGGFDEDFFMYGEDADLCLRAARLDMRRVLFPQAEVVHQGGASERIRADKLVRLFRARALLYRKHWSAPMSRFGVAMLDLWAWSRMIGHTALRRLPTGRKPDPAWQTVWECRGQWRSVLATPPAARRAPTDAGQGVIDAEPPR